jgi:urease accessory protein
MIVVTEILGVASEPRFSTALHDLRHEDKVEVASIDQSDALRRRLRVTTDKGSEVVIALDKGQRLSDGAVLSFGPERAIIARLKEQQWLRLTPRDKAAAAEAGYFVGNLHWRVRFDRGDLLIAVEGNAADYEDRLRHFTADHRVSLAMDG